MSFQGRDGPQAASGEYTRWAEAGGGGLPQTLQGGLGRPVIAVWGFRSESGGGG